MTGVDKLELPQFSIVELRLVSREVRFTTGMDDSFSPNTLTLSKQLTLHSTYLCYQIVFSVCVCVNMPLALLVSCYISNHEQKDQ